MAITIRISLSVAVAALVGELVSMIWLSNLFPFRHYEDHYLITAIVANFSLAVVIGWITR